MLWVVLAVVAVIVVWLAVAYVKLQWDTWTRAAEQSPNPRVRRALEKKSTRVLAILLLH